MRESIRSQNTSSLILHIGKRNVEILDDTFKNRLELECAHIADEKNVSAFLCEHNVDVVFLEYSEEISDFIALINFIKRTSSVPLIISSTFGHCGMIVKSLRNGADNFICEPLSNKKVLDVTLEALRLRVLWSEIHAFKNSNTSNFGEIIGASTAMQTLYATIRNVCKTDARVFIVGASGTGKELVAKAIHVNGSRGQEPFVAINCGAIPPNLLESELFGHERGAFTGAVARRIGKFEQASGATLFLDEISELPLDLQVKLLRVIQEGRVTRVGGKNELKVDPRIICATNRDPAGEVRQGRFREDLYYRLNVVPVKIPPLSDRRSDIPLLCAHFLHVFTEKYGKYFYEFSEDALALLCSYDWPGNVRELENVIERIVVLHDGAVVEKQFLPEEIMNTPILPARSPEASSVSPDPLLGNARPLWQVESDMIKQALRETKGNVVKASSILQIGQASLYRKLKAYDIKRSDYAS
ncbi:MAG: sigma-54-dependent Fis family transcriptional regulator [Kiritimatiellaeota bacterium]|nr:sigma-54-dependent Fis family transcriptional regulator [Kiritimatiellota bacterium]